MTSTDENGCATPVKTFKQTNIFESNGAKKPAPAASAYGDIDEAVAYFEDPRLLGLDTAGTSRWPLYPGGVGTSKWTPDPDGAKTIRRPQDEAVLKEAIYIGEVAWDVGKQE